MPQYNWFYGYQIYYWSDEGSPLEPLHFHIAKEPRKNATKVWIMSDGSMQIEHITKDVKDITVTRIMRIMKEYVEDYTKEWETFFGVKATYYDLQN